MSLSEPFSEGCQTCLNQNQLRTASHCTVSLSRKTAQWCFTHYECMGHLDRMAYYMTVAGNKNTRRLNKQHPDRKMNQQCKYASGWLPEPTT